ncbi:MAG TPA: MFS transporter, partial [Vicinamibacterales bacterium]|nr:MFS transporter [Vicinamibacterales bacterium]
LFALPDAATQSNRFEIAIPGLASLYLTHDWNGEIRGIQDFAGQHPPVAPVFWAFRVMVGVGLLMVSSLAMGCSLVVYDGILCRIATPDERDRISSRGWAWGYVGGAILLAVNLALLTLHGSVGITTGMAVRICLLSAGLWWGLFTLIPVLGLRGLPTRSLEEVAPSAATPTGAIAGAFGQLADTFRELRMLPQTMLFLLAYLFYNDGIQTVISQSSIYGSGELDMGQSQVLMTFLLVQIIAFFGALIFGRAAASWGASRTVLVGIVIWLGVVLVAVFVPKGNFGMFLLLGSMIGLVMGGTQALSRSLYSKLVPRGRESEFFSLYQAMERGTSWLGTLTFGVVFQLTHSYRYAIVALIVFFLVGGALLSRVKFREGIEAAGNQVPRKI